MASSSVNIDTGVFHCHGCGNGGGPYHAALARGWDAREAMKMVEEFGLKRDSDIPATTARPANQTTPRDFSDAARRYASALAGEKKITKWLENERWWEPTVLAGCGIGWDSASKRVTIPIEQDCRTVGLLKYLPNGPRRKLGERKMLAEPGSIRGLFPPVDHLDGDPVVLCEGEPDALTGLSLGLNITSIGGADGWRRDWTSSFAGRTVYVLMDCDAPGRAAAARVAADLTAAAADVLVVDIAPDRTDGWDLTDAVLKIREDHDGDREAGRRALLALLESSVLPQKTEPAAAKRGVVAIRASSIKRERTRWFWAGRIPIRSVTILAGEPKLGKSMLTCRLAARGSRGLLDGEFRGQPVATLMASAEDSLEATMRPRLEAVDADLDLVSFLKVNEDDLQRMITLPGDVAGIADAVRETGAKLIVIDPLMAHLDGAVDSFKDQSIRRALAPLARLADELECAVFPVVHTNKAEGRDVLRRIGGSIGISGAARSILLFGRDPSNEDQRLLVHSRSNLSREATTLVFDVQSVTLGDEELVPTARLRYLGESDQTDADVLGGSDDLTERSKRVDAQAWLRDLLALGPHSAEGVKREGAARGYSESTIKRASTSLGVLKENTNSFPRRCMWTLPGATSGSRATLVGPTEHDPTAASPQDADSHAGLRAIGSPFRAKSAHLPTRDPTANGGAWSYSPAEALSAARAVAFEAVHLQGRVVGGTEGEWRNFTGTASNDELVEAVVALAMKDDR